MSALSLATLSKIHTHGSLYDGVPLPVSVSKKQRTAYRGDNVERDVEDLPITPVSSPKLESKKPQQELSEYTRVAKYSRFLPELGRRETWREQCIRVMKMHKFKYIHLGKTISSELNFVYQMMLDKKILGSQRALQFGGPSIIKKNTRIYNCAASYVDRVRFFQEIMFVLLCGAGCGFSVQRHHVAKLPNIALPTKGVKGYRPEDSIEGWANCIGVLLSSYFTSSQTFPEYCGYIVSFDLSLIRAKGSAISDTNGLAPGPVPLNRSLVMVTKVFEVAIKKHGLTRLRPIDAYDIIMHISDAVLAGGVRRSATLAMFSPDDEDMLKAKTGNWFATNPQRARSNNSAVLIRDGTSKEEFFKMFDSVKQFGEPGFIWVDNLETLFNPCFPDDVWINTSDGRKQIKELLGKPFDASILGMHFQCRTGFVKTGHRQVYKITAKHSQAGTYIVEATGNHKFAMSDGSWKELRNIKIGDKLVLDYLTNMHLSAKASVLSIEPTRICDVYDCAVDGAHAFSANGFVVHNCVEAALYGYDSEGNSGFEFCNLTEINMGAVKNEGDFYESCKAAAIIGTLQAGYVDFGYLGEVTKRIVQHENLLGISMTGMMDVPDIAFNPRILERGVAIIKKINENVAEKLGIRPSARLTCVKPAGTTSCILGTSSGIHPRHAKRYFRRVQANKTEKTLGYYKSINPEAVEESVWSANKTDEVITFMCEANTSAKTKKDVSALDLLAKVKLVQKHWVMPGSIAERCWQPYLVHNVSNTINVKSDEWDAVAEYIYKNRTYYTGVSLLSSTGDKDYHQAPFQAVYDEFELGLTYGEAAIFASGLIIHAHNAFDSNLYAACACFLGCGEKLADIDFKSSDMTMVISKAKKTLEKQSWIARAQKFTDNFFSGDRKKMTYCLKDVDAFHKWCKLRREHKHVDWEKFQEDSDNTKFHEISACAGGACELIRF